MAHGKSMEMRYLGRSRAIEPRETRERDRSLRGKARRTATKAARKAARLSA